jgi:hypothetical protein
MGQYLSGLRNKYDIELQKDKECHICKKRIEIEELIMCVRCNIKLHSECADSIKDNKSYCKCPNCNRIGSLGIKILE